MDTSNGIHKMLLLISLIFMGAFAQTLEARSVYVITKHESSVVAAYKINGSQIEAETTASALPDRGQGAVGLALDPESETLFVTYEHLPPDPLDKIELIDAKIMEVAEGPATAPGASNLAGIVFDPAKQKLYVVDRGDNKLFVYAWDSVRKSLTLEGGTYKILTNTDYAYGLAMDQVSQLLYVTEATSTVGYYDTDDPNFAYRGSIDTGRQAVGIAIDATRRYMYTGSFSGSGGQHTYIVRTDINDINSPTFSEKHMGTYTYVIGLTVDEATGFLYVTTSNDHIEVVNANTWPSDPCHTETSDISSPADIIVAGDVSFKWPYLGLEKVHDVNDCAHPDEAITYTITCDAGGRADSNVVITDYLPVEVDFNSASDGGSYDVLERRVTWHIEHIDAGEPCSVSLRVVPNEEADMHRPITNCCEAEGDRYYSPLLICVDANVCCWPLDIIYVDEDATGFNTGVSWAHAYNELESALNRARTCGANEIWVADGNYHPTSPEGASATFALVDGVWLCTGDSPAMKRCGSSETGW